MPEDILAQTASRRQSYATSGARGQTMPPKPKRHISILGVIITIILAVVLIILGERALFDLNRVANPAVKSSVAPSDPYYYSYNKGGLSYEASALSATRVYYQETDKSKYMVYKLVIHAAVVIPVFLLMFLLYYLFNVKGEKEEFKIVMWGYMVFAIWMMLHLVFADIVRYVVEQFKNAAIYIILGVLIIILTPLAIFIQKKVSEKQAGQ